MKKIMKKTVRTVRNLSADHRNINHLRKPLILVACEHVLLIFHELCLCPKVRCLFKTEFLCLFWFSTRQKSQFPPKSLVLATDYSYNFGGNWSGIPLFGRKPDIEKQ